MSWLVFNTPVAARRFAAAVDVLLDYPRDHLPGESGYHVGSRVSLAPRTDSHCAMRRNAAQTAVEIDGVVLGLVGQSATVQDAGPRVITITLTGADRSEVATLPGERTNPGSAVVWGLLPARDGLGGAGGRTQAVGGAR